MRLVEVRGGERTCDEVRGDWIRRQRKIRQDKTRDEKKGREARSGDKKMRWMEQFLCACQTLLFNGKYLVRPTP